MPLRWVAEMDAGDHLNDGEVDDGGRRFGRLTIASERVRVVKLKGGFYVWVQERVTGGV